MKFLLSRSEVNQLPKSKCKKKNLLPLILTFLILSSTLGGEKLLLSKEMQARDETQLPPTEAEAASGQPAGQYLNPPKQSGVKSKIQSCA